MGRPASPNSSTRSLSASPYLRTPVFMMCSMSASSRSSLAHHQTCYRLSQPFIMAQQFLNQNARCAHGSPGAFDKYSSSGRANQHHRLHGRTSTASPSTIPPSSSRTGCWSRGERCHVGPALHTPDLLRERNRRCAVGATQLSGLIRP